MSKAASSLELGLVKYCRIGSLSLSFEVALRLAVQKKHNNYNNNNNNNNNNNSNNIRSHFGSNIPSGFS